ncbi:hypothetical protein U9M48_027966 [Paspalum notatum var. saurae]|uniref:DUF4005 domain-containing protein n=1 Tax=Paspalum notatum var. saurae TaxID=547442 RepID=A0AAQ3X0K5_PASNO
MGKKLAGAGAAAGWLATARKVFKPSKGQRHATKHKGGELEGTAAGGGDAAETVSVDHFPTAETSPEVTNECSGAVGWREREYQEEIAGASRTIRDGRGGMAAARTAASRAPRTAFVRGRTSSMEELAAVRIQAYYRGYLESSNLSPNSDNCIRTQARRARRALRGLVRLQALARGHQVRRQVHLTMHCMQALIRAQDRIRARRLAYDPNIARRRTQCRDHVPAGHGLLQQQHRGRSSFGYDRVGMNETELLMMHSVQVQAPQRHSSGSRGSWQGTRDAVRTNGVPRGHTVPAAWSDRTPYAYGLQHQRQLDESEDRDEPSVGWHWLERCDTGVHAHQHAPEEQANYQHGPAESSYVTAATTDGVPENTVEMEAAASRKSPTTTRDLYPVRPPQIPGYMAATQSARAKARMAPPAAVRAGSRSRSGSAGPSGGSTSSTLHLGRSMSHNGGSGCASTLAQQQRAVHSPESSCSGDRTLPQVRRPEQAGLCLNLA